MTPRLDIASVLLCIVSAALAAGLTLARDLDSERRAGRNDFTLSGLWRLGFGTFVAGFSRVRSKRWERKLRRQGTFTGPEQ